MDGRREDEGGGGEVGGLVMAAVVALVVVKRERGRGGCGEVDFQWTRHWLQRTQVPGGAVSSRGVVGTWRYLSGLYRQSNSPQAW